MSDSQYDDIDLGAMGTHERRIRKQVRREAEFYKHLMCYVSVMSVLWLMCLLTTGLGRPIGQYWAIWPTLGWGIGVLCHAASTVSIFGKWGSDWEERKVQELLNRERSNG